MDRCIAKSAMDDRPSSQTLNGLLTVVFMPIQKSMNTIHVLKSRNGF